MRPRRGKASVSRDLAARPRRRRGVALVLVLFLLVLATMVVASFTMRTSGAYRVSRSRAVSWRLYYAARAAVEETKAVLWRQLITAQDSPGIMAAPAEMEYDVGGVSVRVEFEDEAGKIPLNDLASPDGGRRKELTLVLARLFEGLDLPSSTSLATAVRDYIDEDGEGLREMGARNEPVFDVCELLMIQGMRSEMLYRSTLEGLPPAAEVLSTWYRGNVNVNSASRTVLKALAPRLTEADMEAIIAAREEAPFKSAEDLTVRSNVSGETLADMTRWVGFATDTLTLRVEAREGEFARRIRAVIWVESTEGHTLYLCSDWQNQNLSE